MQIIKSVIAATISFVLIALLVIAYDIGSFMQDIYKLNLIQIGRTLLIAYVATVAVYTVISYVIYCRKYNAAKKSLRCYFNNLKQLSKLYEEEKK